MTTVPASHRLHRSASARAGDYFTASVANSPLHTHSASGIIHIEPDRPGEYTLGQFFDEWGVRLTQTCLGGYCAGRGKELAVFVEGHRVSGPLRTVVLGNRQEIAVVFGSLTDFSLRPLDLPGGLAGSWLRRSRRDQVLTTNWRGAAPEAEKSVHRPAPSWILIDLLPSNAALVSPSVSFNGATFFSVNPAFALASTTVIV